MMISNSKWIVLKQYLNAEKLQSFQPGIVCDTHTYTQNNTRVKAILYQYYNIDVEIAGKTIQTKHFLSWYNKVMHFVWFIVI